MSKMIPCMLCLRVTNQSTIVHPRVGANVIPPTLCIKNCVAFLIKAIRRLKTTWCRLPHFVLEIKVCFVKEGSNFVNILNP